MALLIPVAAAVPGTPLNYPGTAEKAPCQNRPDKSDLALVWANLPHADLSALHQNLVVKATGFFQSRQVLKLTLGS